MRTVSNQTEVTRRPRFDFKPDRHYVLVEAPSDKWDGNQLDELSDLVDPATGDFAYREEARGTDAEGRRVTGSRRMVMLSCSKEYIDGVTKGYSETSRDNASAVAPQEKNYFENLQVQAPISLESIVGNPVG
jgi:hypothetical protein